MSNVHYLAAEIDEPVAEPSRFEELWRIWPRREKKPMAQAKYEAIVAKGLRTRTLDKDSGQFVDLDLAASADRIIEGAKAYLKSQKKTGSGEFGYKDDGKFIPYLSTWLNGGRWEDWL